MSEALREWLAQELKWRGWSHNELGRQAGLAQSTISSVLAGNKNAGADFCVKVAKALGESPEKLLRLAGILPPAAPASPSDDDTLQELIELARSLPPEDREELLKYARFRYQQRKG